MTLNSINTTQNTFYITSTVFFSVSCIIIIGVLSQQIRWVSHLFVVGFFFLYLISFYGSVKLLYSFPEKPDYRNYIIPFSLVTAFGLFFCAINFISAGTSYEWPLVPLTSLLLTLSNLLLTPAITLLLTPFVKEVTSSPNVYYGCLAVLSSISAGIAIFIIIGDIFPLLDPEFVWSKFWDFGSSASITPTGLSGLYIWVGMPLAGFFSLHCFDDYLKSSAALERGS